MGYVGPVLDPLLAFAFPGTVIGGQQSGRSHQRGRAPSEYCSNTE
jgi:hypothetical protein